MTKNKNFLIENLKQITLRRKGVFIKVFLLEAISITTLVVVPYFAKLQTDQLVQQSPQFLNFQVNSLVVFFLLLLFPFAIDFVSRLLVTPLQMTADMISAHLVNTDVEKLIWEKMKKFDLGFFHSRRNSHLIQAATESTTLLNNGYYLLKDHFRAVTTLIAIIPILFSIDISLLLIIVLSGIVHAVLSEIAYKLQAKKQFAYDLSYDQQNHLRDLLDKHFGELKQVGAVDSVLKRYYRLNRDGIRLLIEERVDYLKHQILPWVVRHATLVGVNLLVARRIFNGDLSIGTFSITVAYTTQISNSLGLITDLKNRWRQIRLNFSKLNFLLQLKPRLKTCTANFSMVKPEQLRLDNVNFSYPNYYGDEQEYLQQIVSELVDFELDSNESRHQVLLNQWKQLLDHSPKMKQVLHNVSLEIKKGRVIALVGRNGSGKTTITRLFMHSYEPSNGRVLLDDKPLYKYRSNQVERLCSYLQQQPFLIDRFSLRQNLLLGVKQQLSDEQIYQMLRKIDLDQPIASLPKQLDSVLGEDTHLSGGQQQLLAIGRALLQNRPFIIFDEGSSQLDSEKEHQVLNLLHKYKQRAGVLFITHRMSVARRADDIYVLDQGRIVEHGRHTELLSARGLYQYFWEMQVVK